MAMAVIAASAAKTAMCQLSGGGIAGRGVVSTYIKDGEVSGGTSFVAMMQPADLGQSHDSPHWLRLNRSRLGRVLP